MVEESESDAAAQHVGEHAEVADQAVERVPERRRAVLLHGKMPEPREPVAEYRQQPEKHPALRAEHETEGEQHEQRAREMQAPRAAAAGLGEVGGVDLANGAVLHALMLRRAITRAMRRPSTLSVIHP